MSASSSSTLDVKTDHCTDDRGTSVTILLTIYVKLSKELNYRGSIPYGYGKCSRILYCYFLDIVVLCWIQLSKKSMAASRVVEHGCQEGKFLWARRPFKEQWWQWLPWPLKFHPCYWVWYDFHPRINALSYLPQIDEGCKASDLNISPPTTELPPKPWWDAEADRSLLVGVFKHGYERYNVMRNDPALCFLGRCGPPDKAALMAEMNMTV